MYTICAATGCAVNPVVASLRLLTLLGKHEHANDRSGNAIDGDQANMHLVSQYRAFRSIGSRDEHVELTIQLGEPPVLGRGGEYTAVDLSGC